MEKQITEKKSIWVTVFGCFGFLYGVVGVIIELAKIHQRDLMIILISLLYIFLSFNLLKLKNWSRVSLLILNAIVAVLITISDLLILFGLPLEEATKIFREVYPYFTPLAFIFLLIFHFYIYGFLIFFTRAKIKEEFKK